MMAVSVMEFRSVGQVVSKARSLLYPFFFCVAAMWLANRASLLFWPAMSHRVLIIGAGGVGRVVTHKCAQLADVFGEIMLASRTKSKCDGIAAELKRPIQTAAVDADNVPELVKLLKSFKPEVVINVALLY